MTNRFLCINNLEKKFKRSIVLSNISFEIARGESLVIQGESGCGKTSLLRCIALMDGIDDGQIIFDGEVVSKQGYTKRFSSSNELAIGMVFQQLYLWQHMSILENVALPLWLRNGKNRKLAEEAAKEQLSQLGIAEKFNEYPNQLSGGQRQRAALARALVHSPKLLLLDEITANLDSENALKVMGIIEKIIAKGTSVIQVTHSNLFSRIWSHTLLFDGITWKLEKLS